MGIPAVALFGFLQAHNGFHAERIEIASPAFGKLRRAIRQIAWVFRDTDDPSTLEVLGGLKRLLSEWLTVPVSFDPSSLDALSALFGSAAAVESRWGAPIRVAYEAAIEAAEDLVTSDSPLRSSLRLAITNFVEERRTLKIYCHKQANAHFNSLFEEGSPASLRDDQFINSLRAYCDAAPFDVLVKVGPLRSRGWGSAPDALKSAPRFATLAQFVWAGTNDDAGFGFDPVMDFSNTKQSRGECNDPITVTPRSSLAWETKILRIGEDTEAGRDGSELDDLQFFHQIYKKRDTRTATLVQLDENQAVPYPPYSKVLSFDPTALCHEPVDMRVPGESLQEGMYLILPVLVDAGIGGAAAKHGSYSDIWKARLKEEFARDPHKLVSRCRAANLGVKHLWPAIEHWCEPPSSVIHAPQRILHFEILCRVLGLEGDVSGFDKNARLPWWQRAWDEIRKSRGDAIQNGFLEKEIIREGVLQLLKSLAPQIRSRCNECSGRFRLDVPQYSDLTGAFYFCPIVCVEQGFHVPEGDLKGIHDLDVAEQWRD